MALAEYFGKNVQAASLLLQGFDAEAFRKLLEEETIGIAFDKAAAAAQEAKATLDLVVRLLARLYPKIALISVDRQGEKLRESLDTLAREINPRIDVIDAPGHVTKWLVVGQSTPKMEGPRKQVIYLGSNNWISMLSTKTAVGSGNSSNPFGAGAAACFGAANLFRCVFGEQLFGSQLDAELRFSTLDLDPAASQKKNSALGEVDLGELHLVGAGAVGNGFLWALGRLNSIGSVTVVDAEVIEESNLQRYAMTSPGHVGQSKAELAKAWLAHRKIRINPQKATWEDYVSSRENWHFERVAVAVDNADSRIHVQASLPKSTFNSWTQAGEVGLSRHTFTGDEACLACLYIPKGKTPNLDEIVLAALRLPQDEAHLRDVRKRLDTGQPTEREFLERIAAAASIPVDRFAPFEGRPLNALYVEAVCGGKVLEFDSGSEKNRAEVPLAFQSALAGVLLAADVTADAGGSESAVTNYHADRPYASAPCYYMHAEKEAGGVALHLFGHGLY